MAAGSVKIGPKFFAQAKRDYANWVQAWVREIAQNSIDASHSDRIDLMFNYDGTHTNAYAANNGQPMDREVLLDKFLALGESGKNFQDTVGGFGRAKELLVMCAEGGYTIKTGNLQVEGYGGQYELTELADYHNGTTTIAKFLGNHVVAFTAASKLFASLGQWGGTFTVNGEVIKERLHKGSRRRELEWGVIYTNNSHPGLLVCRIGGMPMFVKPIQHKGTVLIELKGNSANTLTSNRDGLRYNQDYELTEFINQISTNRTAAFRDRNRPVERRHYKGYMLAGAATATKQDQTQTNNAECQQVLVAKIIKNVSGDDTAGDGHSTALAAERLTKLLHPEFHLINEVGGKVPSWFIPGSFSTNSRRLISTWISVLVELATLTKCDKPFGVGFVIDTECEARYEQLNGRHLVLINPCVVVEKEGKPRQLKTRWSFNSDGNWSLLAVATHEFAHLAYEASHNETYANKLTDLMALVLANRTRFSRHFSKEPVWPESF